MVVAEGTGAVRGRGMRPWLVRVLSSAVFVALGIAIGIEAYPDGPFAKQMLALCALLTGMAAFLQPPVQVPVSAPPTSSRSVPPLGPGWLRWSLGIAACAAALAGVVVDSASLGM